MPRRKKQIRDMRKGIHMESDGDRASHKMEWGSEKKGYSVNPKLFPTKDKPSTDPKDWKDMSKEEGMSAYQEAKKRGEVVKFKSKRRAEKVAAGSWKKGDDKKEAMKDYRSKKKKSRQEALKKAYNVK